MGKKSKRNSGPKPDSRRAELLEARRIERELLTAETQRPFEGLAFECDLVAMREFVASATAPLLTTSAGRPVTLATVLPGAVAALVRDNSASESDTQAEGFVALQVQEQSRDLAADLAVSIEWASGSEPGESLTAAESYSDSPSLVELLDADTPLDITVHADFGWWIPEGTTADADVIATIEQANQAILPSARIAAEGVSAAWWVDAGDKAHLRWVRPEDEDALMLALARLQAAGELHLGEGSRFAGSFRTHGLLVPVFDLDRELHHEEWAKGTQELGKRISDALAVDTPLTADQLRARDGIRSRQVTLR